MVDVETVGGVGRLDNMPMVIHIHTHLLGHQQDIDTCGINFIKER